MREVAPHIVVIATFSNQSLKLGKGVEISRLIDVKATFDAREESDRKRRAEALSTPVHEVSPVVLPNTEEVSSVVKSTANGRESEQKKNVATNKKVDVNGQAVDSRHCRKKVM